MSYSKRIINELFKRIIHELFIEYQFNDSHNSAQPEIMPMIRKFNLE